MPKNWGPQDIFWQREANQRRGKRKEERKRTGNSVVSKVKKREAHFEVKIHKTPHVRCTFGSSDLEKEHAVVAGCIFRSQNVQNLGVWIICGGSDVASLRFRSLNYIKNSTTLQYITLHYIPHYTTVHYTIYYTPRHYNTLHYTLLYTTLPYITLHVTLHTLQYITLHYTLQHYNYNYSRAADLHNHTPLHSITLHYITLHYIPLHSTTLHYITLHYTEWHCTTDRQVDR